MGNLFFKQQGVTVANSSGGVIWAKIDSEKKYTKNVKGGIEGGGAAAKGEESYEWDKIKPGYSQILDNEFMRYDVVTERGEQVYLSIKSAEGKLYTENLPKKSPCGVKVVPSGQVVDVIKGNHIWTEVSPTFSSSRTSRGTAARKMKGENDLFREPTESFSEPPEFFM